MLVDRYPALESVFIETHSYVTSWSKLKELIKYDFDTPWWGSVMSILDEKRDVGAIGWKLKKVGDGESWKYISQKYIRYLRMSDVTIYKVYKKAIPQLDFIGIWNDSLNDDVNIEEFTDVVYIDVVNTVVDSISPTPLSKEIKVESERKNLLALKTNLLFDALSLVNIEIEVPISNRFSIAYEWIFPWWTWDNGNADSKRHRIQMLSANLEGRYWFGNRDYRRNMTGWFAGVYVGGGLYDFEYKASGYQGEFFIFWGLSGGYAHTINKRGNLRMEYSLGVGYMQTDYRYYKSSFGDDNKWHPMRQESGRYTWIGPTKAKVSLVWMLNRKAN